jgi:hypothetical protein
MSDISPSLHAEIVLRAGNRCENCQLSQLGQEAAFHIDHVVPQAELFNSGERGGWRTTVLGLTSQTVPNKPNWPEN